MIQHQSCTGRCVAAGGGCNCWAGVCSMPRPAAPIPAEAATEVGADAAPFNSADREILGFLLRFALALLAIVAVIASASRCAA